MQSYHEPVLCGEVLGFLLTDPGGVYVDATVGGGGHAERILEKLTDTARLIGFDADADAQLAAGERLRRFGRRVTLVHSNFRFLRSELRRMNLPSMSGILLDLGLSSHQLVAEDRGFSFQRDERLDMRLDRRQVLSAWTVINEYSESSLAEVFAQYGEERHARCIARRAVRSRPVDTTNALAAVVRRCVGGRFLTKSLARIFQALRIEVNDELGSLREVLTAIPELLNPGGRCVVIAYHSLEDRIVKQFFRAEGASADPFLHSAGPPAAGAPRLTVLTKRPVVAGKAELARNPRARSAKLRVAEKRGT
jgi:16S rRNA (cytosine1402-N4)-methyltransferase